MTIPSEELVKVMFSMIPLRHGSTTESVWAEPKKEGVFVIQNTPFLAFGVSYLDEIFAEKGSDGAWHFKNVRRKSGHSTYRLIIFKDEAEWEAKWEEMQAIGCTYEEGHIGSNRLLAVDIPKDTDIHKAYALMTEGEEAGYWDFEEAAVGHDV